MLRDLMPRFLTRSLILSAVMLSPMAAMSETEEERATRCAGQAQIVTLAVENRQKSMSEKRAGRKIRKAEGIKDTVFEGHVDLLVNWVYSLPADQLGPEATTAFETACTAYSG